MRICIRDYGKFSETLLLQTFHNRGKRRLLTIGVDDRSLEAIKRRSCHIIYRFGNIPVHLHKEKPRKDTPEETSGEKRTVVLGKLSQGLEGERIGLVREVDLLPSEEQKLDDLDLRLLRLVVNSNAQESAMPEE